MSWITIKLSIQAFWAWLRKNWKVTALTIWSAVIWLISRRDSKAAIELMEANKESYEEQIRSLKKQRSVEREKVEELHLKYREALVKIEEKYSKKEKDLSLKQKSKIKKIIKQAKEDPDEINKKIENLFGFTHIS
tara:strand:- start:486 stop:890 length:405 start_codon:yes stop_codon:yes gene_type:complete